VLQKWHRYLVTLGSKAFAGAPHCGHTLGWFVD
jgi:hypothetical protein